MWPRTFHDRLTAPLPGLKAFARFAREGAVRPGPEGLAGIPDLPYAPGPVPDVDARTLAVTWAGHASWVVRIGGLTVLTDPVWSRRILGTPARVTPVGVAWEALPRVDAVVISHNHYDHLDAPTLRRLPRDTPVFAPAGLGRWFRRRRFTRVTELDWWEASELGGVRFDFVLRAHHWSKRTLTDTCRSLWGGWVLTAPDGRRVHFAGDTGYGHWFSRIGRRYPGIDLTLMPIGAYDPRWWLADVHCDPEEAVRAAQDLGARHMAPMHWGTFVLSAEPVLEPLTRVRAAWEAAGGCPGPAVGPADRRVAHARTRVTRGVGRCPVVSAGGCAAHPSPQARGHADQHGQHDRREHALPRLREQRAAEDADELVGGRPGQTG